jgi:ABC-2 type transport system ATP-binding protein
MKRRLNLAVALVHQPDVLLLDEPTVGVDPQSRNHILERVSQLAKQGLTILFTTHYMEEAERLCHRVAIIDQGQILAEDTTLKLIEQYGGPTQVKARVESLSSDVPLPGKIENGVLSFGSSQPIVDLANLQSCGVRFVDITIDRPNLESVFLKLTGRSLRD